MKERKKCLECGKEIYGRPDKKFCSEHCKNHYHNHHGHQSSRLRYRIINNLEKNHHLLEGLLKLGITSISLSDAMALGFKPSHITGCIKRAKYNELRCFDICYRQTSEFITNIRDIDPDEITQVCRTPLR